MIFVESDNGYKETRLREGDVIILFTDVNRVVLWRGDGYLFWSPLSELPSLLCPLIDIKLFCDNFNGGAEEFRAEAILFANRYGFNLKRKKMPFSSEQIPCLSFKFIGREGQNDVNMP